MKFYWLSETKNKTEISLSSITERETHLNKTKN